MTQHQHIHVCNVLSISYAVHLSASPGCNIFDLAVRDLHNVRPGEAHVCFDSQVPCEVLDRISQGFGGSVDYHIRFWRAFLCLHNSRGKKGGIGRYSGEGGWKVIWLNEWKEMEGNLDEV